MTTVIVADDHQVVRQGLRKILEAEAGFEVIGEASEGLEVVQMVEQLRPDVVILDLMMPGVSGLEAVRQIGKASLQTRIIVFSMHADEAYVLEVLKHGAAGYVLKDGPSEDLIRALKEIEAGRRYLSPQLSERAIEAYLTSGQEGEGDAYEILTRREREVLHLAAQGIGNAGIAQRLFISVRTVETHRTHLMQKLGLDSQTDLVRYAIRRGILSP